MFQVNYINTVDTTTMKPLEFYKHPPIILEPDHPIGFSFVPNQFRKKSILEGFTLNLLVVGRRGLGTTTLINSLFSAPLLERDRCNDISISKNEIIENNIKLNVVITTFHQEDPEKVLDYIYKMNLEYFFDERGLKTRYEDARIHACLYLLPSDEIKEIEIEMLKKVSRRCNLIPIIPKADTFTTEELILFKGKMLALLKTKEIRIYWPGLNENDGELTDDLQKLVNKYPLTTIASENVYEHKGEIIRGRKYKWGFVNVENEDLSDLLELRKLLIHNFLDDLVFQTEEIFYEAFKKKCVENNELCRKHDEELKEQVKREAVNIMEEKAKNELNIPEQVEISIKE